MKTILALIGFALVLAIVGAVFYGGYHALIYLWDVYAGLEMVVRVSVLSGMATLIVAALIVGSAVRKAADSKDREQIVGARLSLYRQLVEIYSEVVAARNNGDPVNETEALNRLKELSTELLMVAGNPVLNIHHKLEIHLEEKNDDDDRLNGLFSQLIKSVRQDLGQRESYDAGKIKQHLASRADGDTAHRESLAQA